MKHPNVRSQCTQAYVRYFWRHILWVIDYIPCQPVREQDLCPLWLNIIFKSCWCYECRKKRKPYNDRWKYCGLIIFALQCTEHFYLNHLILDSYCWVCQTHRLLHQGGGYYMYTFQYYLRKQLHLYQKRKYDQFPSLVTSRTHLCVDLLIWVHIVFFFVSTFFKKLCV